MSINFSEFHFIRPYFLLALLPYFILVIMLVRSKLSHGVWTAVCDAALLPYLLQDKVVAQSRLPMIAGAIAALLAIFALSGPTWERLPTPVFRNDSALIIVLDLSLSMDAGDIKPSRLVMARYKIDDILKQRKDGQTALLVYADEAFTVTPLTNDTETIANQLTALTTQIMPGEGNNILAALTKAVDLLKQAGLQKGQILLITDGGNIDNALTQAKALGAYQLQVLGVGTPGGAPIALQSGGFLKDEQGGIIVDKLDVPGLEKLAQAGGGNYQTLTSDDTDIKSLLTNPTTPLQEQNGKDENLVLEQWSDKGPWLLLVVLPLAALSFRKGLLILVLCVLIPLPKNSYAFDVNWQDLWKTKNQQAQEAFNNKHYDKAADLFENPDWKAAAQYKSGAYDKALENLKNNPSANSLYNQGNALAQSGRLQEALDAYKNALKINPKDSDTLYNKELVEKELEKQKQEQKQQNKDNKQDSQNKDKQNQEQQGDKSEQPSQQTGMPKESDKKPEQKPEQSQNDMENKTEKEQSVQEQKQEDKLERLKPDQSKEEPSKEENKQESETMQPIDNRTAEEKQAHEQWLKRIPDDPAGLLRRKFKYQYDQRRQQ